MGVAAGGEIEGQDVAWVGRFCRCCKRGLFGSGGSGGGGGGRGGGGGGGGGVLLQCSDTGCLCDAGTGEQLELIGRVRQALGGRVKVHLVATPTFPAPPTDGPLEAVVAVGELVSECVRAALCLATQHDS